MTGSKPSGPDADPAADPFVYLEVEFLEHEARDNPARVGSPSCAESRAVGRGQAAFRRWQHEHVVRCPRCDTEYRTFSRFAYSRWDDEC
jgi:hypothetical protein